MSKELHIAIQEAICDLGTDVLKSPYLVNILQDYGAFDVHNANLSVVKSIIEAFIKEQYGLKFIRWNKNSKKKLQKHLKDCIKDLHSRVDGSSIETVTYVIEEIAMASGLLVSIDREIGTKEVQADRGDIPNPAIDTQILSYWETKTSTHYQKAYTTSFNNAAYVGNQIANGQKTLLLELKNSQLDKTTEKSIVHLFLQKTISAGTLIYNTASIFHGSLSSAGRRKYGDQFLRASAAGMNIDYVFGDELEAVFGGIYWEESVAAWESGIRLHTKLAPYLADIALNISTIAKYEWKIKKYKSTYISPKYDTTPPSQGSEEDGCSTLIVVFLFVAVLGFIVALVNGEL